jgi:hypothetical protein
VRRFISHFLGLIDWTFGHGYLKRKSSRNPYSQGRAERTAAPLGQAKTSIVRNRNRIRFRIAICHPFLAAYTLCAPVSGTRRAPLRPPQGVDHGTPYLTAPRPIAVSTLRTQYSVFRPRRPRPPSTVRFTQGRKTRQTETTIASTSRWTVPRLGRPSRVSVQPRTCSDARGPCNRNRLARVYSSPENEHLSACLAKRLS